MVLTRERLLAFVLLVLFFCGCLGSILRTYGPDKDYKMKIRQEIGVKTSSSGKNMTVVSGTAENTGFKTMYEPNVECMAFDHNADHIGSSDTYVKDGDFKVGDVANFSIILDLDPSNVKKARCSYSYRKNP